MTLSNLSYSAEQRTDHVDVLGGHGRRQPPPSSLDPLHGLIRSVARVDAEAQVRVDQLVPDVDVLHAQGRLVKQPGQSAAYDGRPVN